MALIGVTGFIGAGKNTVSQFIINECNYIQDSFAKSLKDATAVLFNWPRHLLEGDTDESRQFRETVDIWWASNLDIPEFTPRLALQLLGTNVFRNHFNPDMWLLTFQNRLEQTGGNVILSDARFANEIQFIKDLGGHIIHVSNGENPEWHNAGAAASLGDKHSIAHMAELGIHESEWAWLGIDSDYTILNDSTLEVLETRTRELINKIAANTNG